MTSLLCLPVAHCGRVVAVAQLINKSGPFGERIPFTNADEEALLAFTAYAASSVHTAHLQVWVTVRVAVQGGKGIAIHNFFALSPNLAILRNYRTFSQFSAIFSHFFRTFLFVETQILCTATCAEGFWLRHRNCFSQFPRKFSQPPPDFSQWDWTPPDRDPPPPCAVFVCVRPRMEVKNRKKQGRGGGNPHPPTNVVSQLTPPPPALFMGSYPRLQ